MKNFFTSKLFLIILVGIFILISFGFARAYYKDYEIRQEIKELEIKEKELQQAKINSLDLLKYVSSDEYVEDQARLELNMLAEGENVIYLEDAVKEKEEDEYEYLNQDDTISNIANYKKWWYYIIKHNLN